MNSCLRGRKSKPQAPSGKTPPLLRGGRWKSFSSGPTSEVPPWNGSVGLVVSVVNYPVLVVYWGGAFLFYLVKVGPDRIKQKYMRAPLGTILRRGPPPTMESCASLTSIMMSLQGFSSVEHFCLSPLIVNRRRMLP